MAEADTLSSSNQGGNGAPPSIKSWILAARPKTLPAAIVPVWVGSILAVFPGAETSDSLNWGLLAATLASCLCIQIATNLFNDAIDHDKGADTRDRLGPVRATASGLLSRKAVYRGAFGFCILATLVAIPLIQARGWPIVGIGTVSLILAFAYTGGPYPLAYRGMGEVFVILFFGFVAVCGSYFVQTGLPPTGTILIISLQVGLYSSVLIAVNNLRDIEEDTRSDKRTLAVRFGKGFARCEIAIFCWLPLMLCLIWMPELDLATFWLISMSMVLGILAGQISIRVFRTEPGRSYNKLLATAALQLLLFAFFLTCGLFLR